MASSCCHSECRHFFSCSFPNGVDSVWQGLKMLALLGTALSRVKNGAYVAPISSASAIRIQLAVFFGPFSSGEMPVSSSSLSLLLHLSGGR